MVFSNFKRDIYWLFNIKKVFMCNAQSREFVKIAKINSANDKHTHITLMKPFPPSNMMYHVWRGNVNQYFFVNVKGLFHRTVPIYKGLNICVCSIIMHFVNKVY